MFCRFLTRTSITKVTVVNVPAGCTSEVQPADVFFFRPFKTLMRKVTGHIISSELPYIISQREHYLDLLSQCCWLMQSSLFTSAWKYPWHRAGYEDTSPGRFQTPAEACFPTTLGDTCAEPGCLIVPFIRCPRCLKESCFEHHFIDLHRC